MILNILGFLDQDPRVDQQITAKLSFKTQISTVGKRDGKKYFQNYKGSLSFSIKKKKKIDFKFVFR